jgi:hypothetical protein
VRPEYNTVTALKNGVAMYGFNLCDQVWDLPAIMGMPITNRVPGAEKCKHALPEVIGKLKIKAAELSAQAMQKMKRCGFLPK